jgi:hypothetical protein
MLATDLSEILFGTPSPTVAQVHLSMPARAGSRRCKWSRGVCDEQVVPRGRDPKAGGATAPLPTRRFTRLRMNAGDRRIGDRSPDARRGDVPEEKYDHPHGQQ